jgi:hypothetical protein
VRWVLLLTTVAACGRLGFDARSGTDADALTGDVGGDGVMHDGPAGDGSGSGSNVVGPLQQSIVVLGTGPQTIMLPNPTTPGTLLVATIGVNSLSGITYPPGWSLNTNGSVSGACTSGIATDPSGTGGQQSFSFGAPAGAPVAIQITEWDGVNLGNAYDAAGFGGGQQPATALTISTLMASMTAGDLAIGTFCEDTTMPAFTAGNGWTEIGQAPTTSASPSLFSEFQRGVPAATITATATGSLSAKYAACVMTFRTM